MREMITLYLTSKGMVVQEVQDGDQALRALARHSFDVIILDLMMPVVDGISFLKRQASGKPILVLSAKDRVEDKLALFELGAYDYMTKPFDLRELAARITTLVRRSNLLRPRFEHREWQIDSEARRLWVHGEEIVLTFKEFYILDFLAKRPQKVFTREELLAQIWGYDFEGDVRVVDTHVKNIREKCKRAGLSFVPIVTVWGIGYRFGGADS